MKETLAQIEAPDTGKRKGFAAGIVLWDDRVVEAAPIVGYMKRERYTRAQVRAYCAQRGWTVRVVHELERERP